MLNVSEKCADRVNEPQEKWRRPPPKAGEEEVSSFLK